MPFHLTFHYDNSPGFHQPYLWIWYGAGSAYEDDFGPSGQDAFGFIYDIEARRLDFGFKFKDGAGTAGPWEGPALDRRYRARSSETADFLNEIWCRGDKAFIYPCQPKVPEDISALEFLEQLEFQAGIYVPNTGGLSGLGANLLKDGRILFGFYHPNAARVYVRGSFNEWQRPGVDQADPTKFIEMNLYRGYFNIPNTWLVISDRPRVGDEYKFFVQGGVASDEKGRLQQDFTDPYARHLGPDFRFNNSVIVDPTTFSWSDSDWVPPDISQLIIYELSIYGFTEGDSDIQPDCRGKFKGVTERIQSGYFNKLGVTALALMPLAEVPSMQGAGSLGYDPSLFFTVERDFGVSDDLRELVNAAHEKGLAVVLDEVFNHTSNDFNPLYKMVLEHPNEEFNPLEGELYFDGTTQWGNRIATWKEDVQNMLIDACKFLMHEYHVDGFRLDATHHNDIIEFSFLSRLDRELKQVKPGTYLIAENLPNQSDLNFQGYDGYGQWCDPFHDKIKALLREGEFQGTFNNPDNLGNIFYFSKQSFAAHTNNVVNYCESHDETSVSYEVGTNGVLNNPAAKDRKGRLGLFASLVALGQPMIYMGGEFNVERDRNFVQFTWPSPPDSNGFFQWAYRLINLRKRYPGLKLSGYNPAEEGKFIWILAPWMEKNYGGGKRVIGWRSRPTGFTYDTLVVMMNFENQDITVDVDFGHSGIWVNLANIDQVNDIAPEGTNTAQSPNAIHSNDGNFGGFTLPSSSGFIYKWESSND